MRIFHLFLSMLFFISGHAIAEALVETNVLGGKIVILSPPNFGAMPSHLLEVKYPASRRPTEVLSDKTGAVTLAFNHTKTAMQPAQVKDAHQSISNMFHNIYPSATWMRDEVIEQNGQKFIVLELITPAVDTKIHNIIYGTSVDGRFLLAAFNTTIEKSETWLPIGKKIMSSLAIK